MLGDAGALIPHRGPAQDGEPAAITDVGCERDINEDRYAVIDCSVGRLWVVCDGMGGVQGGELAAQLAIDAMRRGLESEGFDTPAQALSAAIEEANRVIVLRRQNPQFSSMGTTTVAAIISGTEVIIGSAGDSRAYLVRNGEIQQLTVDHTYVQDLVERGLISQEEAMSHPQAHVLTKCLGAEPRLEVDQTSFWIWDSEANTTEDRLVLCSDGLYSHVTDEQIAEIASQFSPQEACVKLVELAKSGGGYDNITLAVLPLGGQLREEAPSSPPKSARLREKQLARENQGEKVPWSRQLMIMFFIAIIGAILTTLVVFLQVSAG